MLRRVFCKLLLVVVVVFSLLVLSGVLLAQGRSEIGLARAIEVQEEHTARLLAKEGVEGTAIGLDENDRLAIKVFTDGPGVAGIPRNIDGVPVEIVVTGKFYALKPPADKPGKPPKDPDPEPTIDPTARFDRPVPIGVSTGHFDITAGTIGCRVTGGGNVYALSNNHVYANENMAGIGDNVLQPGPYDGGTEGTDSSIIDGDEIGTLAAFVRIDFQPDPDPPYDYQLENTVDAAIALCDGTLDNSTPTGKGGGYGVPSSSTAHAFVGQPVQKYGRTTGLTKGYVSEINAAVLVGYSNNKVALFVNQIVILPNRGRGFSDGGDSGSLIVTDDDIKNPVGLLFAGGGRRTIANPIDDVLNALSYEVDDTLAIDGD